VGDSLLKITPEAFNYLRSPPIAKPDVFVKREIAVASLLHSFDVARADAVILQSHQTILDFMAFSRVSASRGVRRRTPKRLLKEKQTKCL